MSTDLYDMRVRLAQIFGPLFDQLTDAEIGAAAVVMRRCDARNAQAVELLKEWMAYGGNQDVRRASERWLDSDGDLPDDRDCGIPDCEGPHS